MWATRLAVLTGLLALALSVAFAFVQNPGGPRAASSPTIEAQEQQEVFDRGRRIFETSGCARCHSFAGQGNLRSPLDGIADRLAEGNIRNWIVGAPELEQMLPPRAFAAKQRYQQLDPDDLDALVAFLVAADVGSTSDEDASSNERAE